MELNDAQDLIDILQGEGYEAELYENYSGRGMYGNTTIGVTTDARPHTIEDMNIGCRSDNMGLDYIYY